MSLTATQFLANIDNSHKANELEQAMAHVFMQMVADNELVNLNDLFNYGVPWRGSNTVVERFSKLHGLAVLRRNNSLSDKLMQIILANWIALASERGLGFLQFVLNMLYPEKNTIIRLWHSKQQAQSYPDYLSEHKRGDRFLTSRIRIKLDDDVDISELSELTPTLSRLIPAHIVPEFAVGFEAKTHQLGVAVVTQRFYVANFTGLLTKQRFLHDAKISHDGLHLYSDYEYL